MSMAPAFTGSTVSVPASLWKKAFIFMGVVTLVLGAVITKDDPFPRWLLVAGALAGGVYFLRSGLLRSEVMLCLLVAYLPFSLEVPVDILPGVNLTNILIGMNLLLGMRKSKAESLLHQRPPLKTSLSIFVILGLISILRGAGYGLEYLGEAGHEYFRKWLIPVALYFVYSKTVRDKETLKYIVVVLMAVVTLVGLMSIYEYMDTDDRVGGIFYQPNQLAAFFNYYMFIPFAFFFLNMRRIKSWAWLVPFLICVRGVMVTFSRAGYLALAVSVYAITFFRSKKLLLLLGLLTAVVVLNPNFLPQGIRYRLGQTLEEDPGHQSHAVHMGGKALDQSSSDRVKVWAGALHMIQEHPVFGIGYFLFESKIRHYYTGLKSHDPHNTYLHIAAEMGIPALLVFLWVFWKIFLEAHRLYRTTQDPFLKALALGFLAGFFGILISNLYGSRLNYSEVSSYFWILAALIFQARRLETNSHE